MVIKERSIHRYLIFSIILVLAIGLFVDVLDLSTAKYASISLELFKNGDWPHTHPLLLGLPTLSFKLFGISNFSYKLFGVVFTFLGIYSTFQLSKIYYGQRAGRIAAIILGTTQGLTIALNWQPNTLLMGSIVFSVWQITEYLRNHQAKNFLLGVIGISISMLAQGPIGLLIPISIIGCDLVLRQKWKDLFKWQWVLGLIIIAFFLAPMIYARDKQLIISGFCYSGIDFFFSKHLGQPNPTPLDYFNYSWGFLPWTILFTFAFFDKLVKSFGKKTNIYTNKYPENISILGIVATMLIFIMMQFHTANTLFILAPFGAMLTAAYLDKITQKNQHFLHIPQAFLIFVLWMLLFLLLFYIFTPVKFVVAMISILLFALTIWSFVKLPQKNALVVGTAIWSIGFGLIQIKHIYPRLSDYQSGVQVGKWLKEHPKESEQFSNFRILSYTEKFYSQKVIDTKRKVSQLSSKDRFLYTNEIGLSMIKKAKIPFLIMKAYNQTNVSSLNLTFLNPKTRHEALKKRYLIAIYPQGK